MSTSTAWFLGVSYQKGWLRKEGALLLVACLGFLALALKVALALQTQGTNDIVYWEVFLATLKDAGGIGVYQQIVIFNFNHPPFMLHLLRVMDAFAEATGLPFAFWLRVPSIVADAGSLVTVARLLASHPIRDRRHPTGASLALLAVAPVSIMVSGFHGNTDSVMIFFMLLSLYCLDAKRNPWLAGAAFGMAINIKVVPLIFVPALALYLWKRREFSQYFGTCTGVVLLGSMPYILQDPLLVARNVLGYGSYYGYWGISRLTTTVVSDAQTNAAYAQIGRFLSIGLIAFASVMMGRRKASIPIFFQCGVIAFLFLTFTPGFGIQYLTWLVPWVVGLGFWPTALYYVTSGVFAFSVYTYWSHGLPWVFADVRDFDPELWPVSIVYIELICWLSVVLLLCQMVRIVVARGPGADDPRVLVRGA